MSRDVGLPGQIARDVELEFVGAPSSAGGNFVTAGQVRGVILGHLGLGEIDAAAALLATSAPEVGDALLDEDAAAASGAVRVAMAEMFFRARDFARAGRAAVLVGDPARAASFFERSYQHGRAAQLYEQAGQLDRAAAMHEREQAFDRAAQLYEQLGQLDLAAEAHEKGGRGFEAGRLWAKLRRFDRAVDALQKVPQRDPRWASSVLLLGRIFEHAGHRDVAVARYLEVAKAGPPTRDNVGVFERLGELYAQAGEVKAARKLLRAVLAIDPTRERAAQGLASLPPEPPGAAHASMPPKPGAPLAVAPLVLPPLTAMRAPAGAAPAVAGGRGMTSLTAVHEDVDTLRQLPLFADLSLDELRTLHALGHRRAYAAGALLIEQGQAAEHVIVLLAGSVQVSARGAGPEVALAELGYGAALGEMALVDEGPASARVRARTDVTAFVWPIDGLRRHLASDERTALRVLKVISRTISVRLREANRRLTG